MDSILLPEPEAPRSSPTPEEAPRSSPIPEEPEEEEPEPVSAPLPSPVQKKKGCTACGPVANARDLDPDLLKKARKLRKRSTRSLGFLRSDSKPMR